VAIIASIAAAWSVVGALGHAQSGTTTGVVAGVEFIKPTTTALSSSIPSHYEHATVCADVNGNGACDAGEPQVATDAAGQFSLNVTGARGVVADMSTTALLNGHAVEQRLVLRAPAGAPIPLVISPLSTEIARMMEDDRLDYATARQKLATRLDVTIAQVTSDPGSVADAAPRASLLKESVILANRFALAAKMADRHDTSTVADAQQAAMKLEAIPRYDHIFIIVLENKATSSIKNSPFAPKINGYLNAGNQFTSYFATGNPSEPNRVAIASGDDFGITDDSAWNCVPSGDIVDLPDDPLPAGLGPCTNAANHNIRNGSNLLSAMANAGMSWRVYSESMNPGRDWRLNSAADNTVLAPDTIYPAGSPVGAIGTPGLMLRMPGSLYATKHNESINFQAVRSAPDFVANNRTLGGGQFDAAMKVAPGTPAGWNLDQFSSDLASGDIGNLNFVEPDQCDDMHGVTLQGTVPPVTTLRTASDCAGNALIYRGDNYTDYLIKKIQASAVWTNTEKRTAIVMMFDEGTATTGFNACCGWNPSAGPSIAGKSLGTLDVNPDGSVSLNTVASYAQGNKGHGTSVFGVITNQPLAPKHVVDSDAYSHISFVRTLQDMFGLSDPGDNSTYMNRSKYTEAFIAANVGLLPEYANSADPHFDAVRPMNHHFAIPDGYQQKSGFVTPPGPQIGPDANQVNGWALRYDPPHTTATVSPLPNATGWTQSPVTIALHATDEAGGPGIAAITYSISGAQQKALTDVPGADASIDITTDGTSTLTFFADGAMENLETPAAVTVRIDKTAPVIGVPATQTAIESVPGGAVVAYPAPAITDATSGLASSSCLPAAGTLFAVGTTTVTCTAADVAGNVATATFAVTVTAAADGRMFGVGHIASGNTHDHFVFRVSQLRYRDNGALEFWSTDARRCGDRDRDEDYDHDRDFNGDHDRDYGRSHCSPVVNRFESTGVTGAVFSDDPGFTPSRGHGPKPTMDSVLFVGQGRWNGKSGYSFEVRATDDDGPRHARDTFSIVVKDATGAVAASVSGDVEGHVESTRLR
jgi:hypothetical protein